MAINDGGPAYPLPVDDEQCNARFDSGYGGMSLRDYFAAQVIGPAFLDLFTGWRQAGEPVQEDWPMGLAIDAYRVADAMIRANTEDAGYPTRDVYAGPVAQGPVADFSCDPETGVIGRPVIFADAAPEAQEPVAWRWSNSLGEIVTHWQDGPPSDEIKRQVAEVNGRIQLAYDAAPVAAQAHLSAKVRERGFVVVDGTHVPTVLVEFAVDDWDARDRFAAAIESAAQAQPDAIRHERDWILGPYVTETMGSGWCVRIDGTDIFADLNRYGGKECVTFQIARGLASKEEAETALTGWILKSVPDRQPVSGADGFPRTDAQIVAQTEELARLLMLEFYSREAPDSTLFRNADDPRGRHVWTIACKAQEILTATDPENAVSAVDDGSQTALGEEIADEGDAEAYRLWEKVAAEHETLAKRLPAFYRAARTQPQPSWNAGEVDEQAEFDSWWRNEQLKTFPPDYPLEKLEGWGGINRMPAKKGWDARAALAAQASGRDDLYATVNAVVLDLLDAETAERVLSAIDARAAHKAKEQQ